MDERNNHFDFDFTPIGQAIKKAREARGMTREELSGIIGYAPRHIQSIENEGQYPSIELFIQLITMFDVSVDEYILIFKGVNKRKNKRTTISNDTLILIQFLIKVDIYRYGSFSPLIFPYILSVSLSVSCRLLER